VETSEDLLFVKRLVAECVRIIKVSPRLTCSPTVKSVLYADNQPSIDSVLHGKARNKHYSVKVLYLAECVSKGLFEIKKVHTADNKADIFTKPLRAVRMKELLQGVMIRRNRTGFGEASSRGDIEG
jgi:hypothetical protein